MKLGIVGAGMIVHDFLTFAHELHNIEIVAICATPAEEEKIQNLAKENKIAKTYTNYGEMLKNNSIDTIYIAVPNHLHFHFTKKALESKKHAICEKPFTSNSKEAKELVEIARSNHLFLFEAVSTRFLPNVHKIKEMLPQLGNIKLFTANYSQYSSRYNAFKNGEILPAFDVKKSGGALMDLNIYNINLVVSLFGAPEKVDYHANIEHGIDTSGILTLDYPTFKFVGIAAKDCKAPIMSTIQGDAGYISIDSSANIIKDFLFATNSNNDSPERFDSNQGKHRMFHEFLAFIKMIEENDLEQCNELLQTTLITMAIQTKARKQASIVFPAD